VSKFRNQTIISLREYFEKDGEMLPTKKGIRIQIINEKKGITLTVENWNKLKEAI
jgi:hypothetical protein